jgi:hypothetical protein
VYSTSYDSIGKEMIKQAADHSIRCSFICE